MPKTIFPELNHRFKQQLDFIIEIDRLKKVVRQTLLMDSSKQENDAEHSWHMALSILLLEEYAILKNVNLLKSVKMALIHDIVEIDAGDTFAYDEKAHHDKTERELKAADRIFGLLPEDQYLSYKNLWLEFEEGKTPEAAFAGAIDKFMPILHNYITEGKQWKKHKVTAEMVLKRNAPIKNGSEVLWSIVENLVDDAVVKGYLHRE